MQQDDGIDVKQFVYDGNNLLQERDDLGAVEADYTYVPQPYAQFVSQQRDGESSFYHTSGVSDVTQLTDDTGTVTDDYRYDAWGKPLATTGATENLHTYKGEVGYQETPQLSAEESSFYLHHRILPSNGQFLSEDPAEDDANPYRYVRNNPVNAVDPSGLQEQPDIPRLLRDLRQYDPLTYEYFQKLQINVVMEDPSWENYLGDGVLTGPDGRARSIVVRSDSTQFEAYSRVRELVRSKFRLGATKESYPQYVSRRADELGVSNQRAFVAAPGTPEHNRSLRERRAELEKSLNQYYLNIGANANEAFEQRLMRDLNTHFGPGGTFDEVVLLVGAAMVAGGAVARAQGTAINQSVQANRPVSGAITYVPGYKPLPVSPPVVPPPASIYPNPASGYLMQQPGGRPVALPTPVGVGHGTMPALKGPTIAPDSAVGESSNQTVYRVMSEKEFARVQANQGLTTRPSGSSELGITLNQEYSADLMSRSAKVSNQYKVVVEFEVRPGTWDSLLSQSATHPSAAELFPNLPAYRKGMQVPQVKVERGGVISILLEPVIDLERSKHLVFKRFVDSPAATRPNPDPQHR